MEKLDSHINKYKELKAPHTGIYFGITSGSVAAVPLFNSMAVSGTVDSETSITGTDGITYKTRRFTGNGTFTPSGDGQIQYLMVAGGGGGGANNAGGGGAGGYRTNATGEENPNGADLDELLDLADGVEYTVVVGDGATQTTAEGDEGDDTTIAGSGITTIVAKGGGGGGTSWAGSTGGSGGGHGMQAGSGSAALTSPTVQGYAGGSGIVVSGNYQGGGGGGAGGSGGTGTGGNGRNNAILTGSDITYAGGGGGVQKFSGRLAQGTGGSGGGGRGGNEQANVAPVDGTDGLGGGGGGSSGNGSCSCNNPTDGGSGIVIIRWQYE